MTYGATNGYNLKKYREYEDYSGICANISYESDANVSQNDFLLLKII